ncbi:cytochrome P450 [Colletotrichum phormii]|uniref:Cytochrome P450 n=1 Tax=Colletotrichum phormii TaxID=359342 RepID=A0AAJ0EKD7_9PEZI|nr:cytochrome P450 [Colletotrichum phormii]KAK1655081.1 cytochrome P450 [Colletotrichum phormii]
MPSKILGVFEWIFSHPTTAAIVLLIPVLCLVCLRRSSQDEPPSLPEIVPFISNTYQYMTDSKTLMKRASRTMKYSNIVKFYLGPMRVYFVQGGESVQAMFRSSTSISSNKFILLVMRNLQGSAEKDVAKFANDQSGRQRIPAPGYENTPQEERFWYTLHHITVENLSRAEPTAHLAETYTKFFDEALEKQPLGQWATVRLLDFLRKEMCSSAIKSFCGTKLLDMVPDYVEQFWRFDSIAFQVVYGLPKWINSKPVNERDKLNGMTQKYLKEAFANFDWDGPRAKSPWEPIFGSSYVRKIIKWLQDTDMAPETKAGFYMIAIFGINANTIPITTWAMIELLRDRELLQAVRSEALQTLNVDPVTGKRSFDVSKLVSMPLMQSVYTECMRLHVSIALSREVIETTTLHGFRLKKGSMIQAPTHLVHLDENIWSQGGHPAAEFWAERHVKHVKKVEENTGRFTTERQFVLAGKSNEFIPFGGGPSMCPGRFFAKQEILLTIAILVTKFDMEFVEWTNLDGSKSDRSPVDDERYFGTAAVPPDRDVKVRWKKLW